NGVRYARRSTFAGGLLIMQTFAIVTAALYGILMVGVFLGPILYAWEKGECPSGGEHEEETIESSQTPPFHAKHRCTKCGRVTATATYAL
ncbi:MAG: hypothetical protein Q8R16_03095, partial [bacterium]|nr:hypothetical protein [bacterium]